MLLVNLQPFNASLAQHVVSFEPHDSFDVRLPAELKEKYTGNGYELEGTAIYSRFRKFRVTTDEIIK